MELEGGIAIECKCKKAFGASAICDLLEENDAIAVKITRRGEFVAVPVNAYLDMVKALLHLKKKGNEG